MPNEGCNTCVHFDGGSGFSFNMNEKKIEGLNDQCHYKDNMITISGGYRGDETVPDKTPFELNEGRECPWYTKLTIIT